MGPFGREVMRRWKAWSPEAYDSLRDPAAYFEHIDRHAEAWVEEQTRAGAEEDVSGDDLRFRVRQRTRDLLESWPMPPREETFLEDFSGEMVDPRGRFVREGMPHRPHRLWWLLEDPHVPAALFQRELRSWFETLPAVPWIEHAGPTRHLFEADSSGDLVRAGSLRLPEIRSWPQATVVTFQKTDDLENAFEVMDDAVTAGRPWASHGYIDRSEHGLVLPPLRDDGSVPVTEALSGMTRDCGPLLRGVEYVVTGRRPYVVDFHAVSWHLGTDTSPRTVKPWLLLDIDGVLLPDTSDREHLDAEVLDLLDELTKHYECAWATSWEDRANSLLERSGRGPWRVIPVTNQPSRDPDGFDSPRVGPILDFVGDRPFAWVDDQLGRRDAARLTAERDCMLLRPNPQHGLTSDCAATLLNWLESHSASP